MPTHEPVMTAEVVEWLAPARGGLVVDCTVGAGGHASALLEAGASRLLGIDRDESAIETARAALAAWRGAELVHADYRELGRVLDERGIDRVDGVVADLGLSSMQLEEDGRGFSFQRDEPLDMRMDRSTGPTAADLLAGVRENELADVIYQFGEERYSRRIARAIVTARAEAPLRTTAQLAAIVRRAAGRRGAWRIDPATRTFQAIRIWVNRELEGLDAFILEACRRLAPGGRLVVVAFHSLEDRVVKHTLRALQREDADPRMRVLTRKPAVPSDAEVARNPRARSAKLRAAERLGG